MLTQWEKELLQQASKGLRNKQIAGLLFISEETVKKHFYNIFQKVEGCNKLEGLNKIRSL